MAQADKHRLALKRLVGQLTSSTNPSRPSVSPQHHLTYRLESDICTDTYRGPPV